MCGGIRISLPESTESVSPASPGSAPVPSHLPYRRSTRSSASSSQSSSRHRRSRSAWAAEPSGRKSLGPWERWGSFWDRERAARSSRALGKEKWGLSQADRAARLSPRPLSPPQRSPHSPCDSPRPGSAPEHASCRNLHGGQLWFEVHWAAVYACARTAHAPPTAGTPRGPRACGSALRSSGLRINPPLSAFLAALGPSA